VSGKITALSAIASVQSDDVLPVVDVHDTSMASSGTTKKISVGALAAAATGVTVFVPKPTGVTATDTPAVTAAITSLVNALSSGPATLLFQDGTYQIDSNSAVIRSCSNFAVKGAGATVITQAPPRAGLPGNTTGNLLTIADCTDFRVADLTIDALRDSVSPMTPLSASCSSGQPSLTVAAGQGSRYQPGQGLLMFGGLGSSEQGQNDGLGVGVASPLIISSITPGGGSGGGDLITFTANIGHSYTQISSTPVSDGFGPYAYAGAYVTPYQCAVNNTVAGRTLSGEDQQNGLHLISCQRFTVSRVTSRNLWESGIKCGTGEASTSLTDGCSDGTITDCITYHGYDQGVSLWVSQRIAVHGCDINASGWAGISMTASDHCVVIGNRSLNNVYAVPGDLQEGSGVAIEGGIGNQVAKNILTNSNRDGIRIILSPLWWGLSSGTYPTTSTFLAEQTAAGTSIQVSATSALQQGGLYSIWDGSQTEAVTVATIVDGTHVTLKETLQFSHPSGCFIARRIAQENVIEGNTINGTNYGDGIKNAQAVRSVISGNRLTSWGLLGTGNGINLSLTNASGPSNVGGNGSRIEGNILRGGLTQGIVAYGVSGTSMGGLTISGNIIANPGSNDACIDLRAVTDSVVHGNRITDYIGGGNGILLNVEGSTACARVTIEGNTIKRGGQPAILAFSADSLVITGNQCDSNGGGASVGQIYLRGVSRSIVSANVCNSGSGAGIQLNDNGSVFCLYNRIVNNTCRDDGTGFDITTGNSWTQQYGIRELGSSDYNMFIGNECDANGNTQLVMIGTHSVQLGNILSGASPAATGSSFLAAGVGAPGASGLLTDAAHVHPSASMLNVYQLPSGATAENVPRHVCTASSAAGTSGTLYLASIGLPSGLLVSNITLCTGSAAKTGGTHGWYVLLDSGLVVRAVTADQTDAATVWGTINTAYTLPVGTPYTTTYSGLHYIGVMVAETAGTMPNWAYPNAFNNGLQIAPFPYAISSSGQTTPPALAATMGALTATTNKGFYTYTS
jgi:hypothetical protein